MALPAWEWLKSWSLMEEDFDQNPEPSPPMLRSIAGKLLSPWSPGPLAASLFAWLIWVQVPAPSSLSIQGPAQQASSRRKLGAGQR